MSIKKILLIGNADKEDPFNRTITICLRRSCLSLSGEARLVFEIVI